MGGAFECICDKQHRVLIPPTLREYAQFEKEIVMVGVIDHIEIWCRDKWDSENSTIEDDMSQEELRNVVAKLGL